VGVKVGQMAAVGATPVFRVVNFNSAKSLPILQKSMLQRFKTGNNVLIYFPDYNEE